MKVFAQRGIAAVMLSAALAACGTAAKQESPAVVNAAGESLIADSLISALAQVPSLNPLSKTVQMSPPTTSFGKRVGELLADAGYGIQTVDGDAGEYFVRYREEAVRSELGLETSFLVAIGDVSVARSFDTLDRNKPVPLSPLYIAGASEFEVEMNDDAFAPDSGGMTYALFDDVIEPQVYDFDTQSAAIIGNEQVATAAVTDPSATFGQTSVQPNARSAVKENLYERVVSNYTDLFASYTDVQSEVLEFSNDSMRLGDANKRIVQSYVKDFNPDTDLVSIIGCSHGNTDIKNGNAVLAVGRANRVKEAFLFAGLDDTKVLEEGCWAGEYHELMPKRGVLLTLKRRAG